ncbi:Metallo-dependent phosphatase-like protein [Blastocladiella britannica]|nr:Metallo-dependent phosphatase-like protein [Blastocladiella britannica]
MVLVLAIGDFHIPHRAAQLPAAFLSLLQPGKIHTVLCTGNLTLPDTADWLRTLAPHVHLVAGEYDLPAWPSLEPTPTSGASSTSTSRAAPTARVVAIGPLRIGLMHGHALVPADDADALAAAARLLDVDVVVAGPGYAGVDCYEYEGRFFVNPGSATGVSRAGTASFVLLDVVDTNVTAYVYQADPAASDTPAKIVKVEYAKAVPVPSPSSDVNHPAVEVAPQEQSAQ